MMGPRGGKWEFIALTVLPSALLGGAANGETVVYANEHPEIQMFSYPAGSANGPGAVRDRAPIFGAFSGFDQETQEVVFFEGSGLAPSRRGSFIIAADTSTDIPIGLAPSRYQIESLKITSTVLGSLVFPGFELPYDNTIDDSVALTTGGGDDPGHPIELYGIGLQGDYETIAFDGATSNALQLGDVRWRQYLEGEDGYDPALPAGEQATAPYQFFALDADGRDAENAVVGGYSATQPGNTTDQFTPEPFAIGKLYDEQGVESTPGTSFQNGDVFVFEPNLQDAGILSYLQQSLSEGHLGFSVSSLHQPAGHTGSVPYPDFYLDNLDVGNNLDGDAPTIEFIVTILDDLLPGDYDESGYVDGADHAMWTSLYGGEDMSADGSQDGVVNAADYAIWRDSVGTGTAPVVAANGVTAPEPSSLLLTLVCATSAVCQLRTRRQLGVDGRGKA